MSSICLVVALPAESRPLIEHFRLRAANHARLRLFDGERCCLLQCGLGKLQAAANTAALLQARPDIRAVINAGIAGARLPIGTTAMAHAVLDAGSGRRWYPHLPAQRKLVAASGAEQAASMPASVEIVTVDQPCTDYTASTAFDMEASGIFTAASSRLDLAFVHSAKVISDNASHGLENINRDSVSRMLVELIPLLELLMDALPFTSLPCTEAASDLCARLAERMHYTSTERHNLQKLLQRHQALLDSLPEEQGLARLASARDIRLHLQTVLDNTLPHYPDQPEQSTTEPGRERWKRYT